jgi:glutathione S-transferase
MAHGFDVVPVRVQHEGTVIVLVIVGPEPRCTVVFSSSGERSAMKCIDLHATVGAERDMHARLVGCPLGEPEISLRRHAITDHHPSFRELRRHHHQCRIAERSERLLIEAAADLRTAYLKTCVIDHEQSLGRTARSCQAPAVTDRKPRLIVLPISPWSERARWALDHHRIDYRTIVHLPVIGELRLRRLLGTGRKRATAPALLLPDRILYESWDIVQYADREGQSAPLLPNERLADIRHYNDLADRTMQAGRAIVSQRLLASPGALEETLPRDVPRWLRPWLRPLARHGARWFARKYEVRLDDTATYVARLRATLSTLRAALAQSAPHLLGTFSYADILMATLLQGISPVAGRYIHLGPATRQVWTQPELAAEFPDLIAWRDELYERHRALPAGAQSAA